MDVEGELHELKEESDVLHQGQVIEGACRKAPQHLQHGGCTSLRYDMLVEVRQCLEPAGHCLQVEEVPGMLLHLLCVGWQRDADVNLSKALHQ